MGATGMAFGFPASGEWLEIQKPRRRFLVAGIGVTGALVAAIPLPNTARRNVRGKGASRTGPLPT